MAAPLDILKKARTSELLDELISAINMQMNAGVANESDLIKIIKLVKDANKLRRALKYL